MSSTGDESNQERNQVVPLDTIKLISQQYGQSVLGVVILIVLAWSCFSQIGYPVIVSDSIDVIYLR